MSKLNRFLKHLKSVLNVVMTNNNPSGLTLLECALKQRSVLSLRSMNSACGIMFIITEIIIIK